MIIEPTHINNIFYKTRDGRKVRIYAVDGHNKYPIHGAIWSDYGEGFYVQSWTATGVFDVNNNKPSVLDIVGLWEETAHDSIKAPMAVSRKLYAYKDSFGLTYFKYFIDKEVINERMPEFDIEYDT